MSVPDRPDGAARLLHTSDWHLGVTVRGYSRRDDHAAVIDEIVAIAERTRPDLIVHTGDLFDGHRPAMAEFGDAITSMRRLAEVAPVALLAGNHDSAGVFEVLALALEDFTSSDVAEGRHDPAAPCPYRIRVHPKPTTAVKGAVTVYPTASGGTLRLVGVPFVHQNRVLRDFAEAAASNATYADRLSEILATYTDVCFDDFDPGADVAVLASHLHLRGARTSTERTIHISEDYATDAAAIDARYGYLAFGHIHVPQVVAGERGRYAGSILEVDFGEEGESKQVTVVDLEPGRPAAVHDVPLTVGRRLRRITLPIGSLDQLAGQAADAIVELTVTAEPGAAPDPAVVVAGTTYDSLAAAVADHLGDAVVVSVIDGRSRGQALELDDVETVEAPPLVDMFREWLAGAGVSVLGAGNGGADARRVVDLFSELHDVATSGAELDLPELVALDALDDADGHASDRDGADHGDAERGADDRDGVDSAVSSATVGAEGD